ncbi:SMI1/KNR4 family protein [Listeria monocytogenes]|uniref:SMI1/KNR4 family protein n=1 Tax=Listeria monocytogenes TaxID=1639 RepID=A0A823INM2_LISMN|nr:SMI1/KNR4 family protein [Listeria monocytogenes]EAE5922248.1 SMI1/KNR4 family protein [Listeria monocytogenes]EAF5832090.1 SMI1/KNR4 family protein [Listeria monocytogenes]EAF6701065.1 SMI1/KNR4 family protein [Listeria monocytogenes]EAG6688112.1 SMI1/KNR4 family protein [Listeria monocytogenes]EAG9221895.1 SMI1/KNR4 family protein [Listeria monocytogenes]
MDVFEKLEEFYKQHSGLKGQPATEEQIHEAEKILDVQFNKQYIHFIKQFGGAFGGISIHAFNNGSLIGKATVIDLTLKFRKIYGETISKELSESYVVSDDGSGNPILMDTAGKITIYYHDSGESELLYDSLQELLTLTMQKII